MNLRSGGIGRLARAVMVFMVLLLTVAACSGGAATPEQVVVEVTKIVEGTPQIQTQVVTAAAPQEVVFYSGLQREITDALVADFQSKNPNIDVVVFQAPIEALLQKIELEVESTGGILADVIWTGDILIMNDFKDRGLLDPYVPPGADQIPANLKDPDGYWHTTVPLSLYIMYNTNNVSDDEVPTAWSDLTDTRWQDRIALSDPSVSGTAAILAASLADKYGWEYWQQISDLNPLINPSTVSLLNLVVSGERDVAPMVDFLVWQSLEKGDPVNVVSPQDGLPGTYIIEALVHDARHQEAAKKLIDYLVSLDAAKLQTERGFYHSRMDAPAPEGMPAMQDIQFMDFDWDSYADNKDQVKENFREIMQP